MEHNMPGSSAFHSEIVALALAKTFLHIWSCPSGSKENPRYLPEYLINMSCHSGQSSIILERRVSKSSSSQRGMNIAFFTFRTIYVYLGLLFCHGHSASYAASQLLFDRCLIDNVDSSRCYLIEDGMDSLALPMCFCRHTFKRIQNE